jgi:Trypsin-like peptidase domain/Bacterial PH domain
LRVTLAQVVSATDPSRIVGGAAMLTEELLLTCAHVVEFARDGVSSPGQIGSRINVRFPFAEDNSFRGASVEACLPHRAPGVGDIALLRLHSPASPDIPVPSWGAPTSQQSVRALGYPSAGGRALHSQWITGVCGDRHGAGWLQIEDPKQTGYWVRPGFSGSPVWDSEEWSVLGIITAAEPDVTKKVAFIVPASYLVKWAAGSVPDGDVSRLAAAYQPDRLDSIKTLKRAQLAKSDLLLTPGAVRSLSDYLRPGELCMELTEVAITGVIGTQFFTGLLAATDRRIVFIYKLPAMPAIIKEYPYSKIKRIDWGFKAFGSSSTVRIEAGHRRRLSVTEFNVERITALVNYAQSRLVAYRGD